MNGIIWTYIKDVSRYIPLFAKAGALILDLNNIVDPTQGLTGEYDGLGLYSNDVHALFLIPLDLVRLSATFFASDAEHPPAKTADAIIPISNLSPDMANYVSVPPDFSVSLAVRYMVLGFLMHLCFACSSTRPSR